jgi:PleD family two-component response regulator
LPEVDDWLDAMEAGAADYCAEPIEKRQLDWILESNLERKRQATVAA